MKPSVLVTGRIPSTVIGRLEEKFQVDVYTGDSPIKPEELKETLIKNDFILKNIKGMNYNPITQEWKINNTVLINYFCTAMIN